MIKVGITGQEGFVGQHLYHGLGLLPDEFERVEFKREYFEQSELLNSFVTNCDVIVHLAAMNRHKDPQVIYDVNKELVEKLVQALVTTKSKAHIIFSSSSQEEKDNLYGRSKKEGRLLLNEWARENRGKFSGLIIPNVFGPFGKAFYNSFIATFSHQLCFGDQPQIDTDSAVQLIYVGDLVANIISEIRKPSNQHVVEIQATDVRNVSEVLSCLKRFEVEYLQSGIIPELNTRFEINLFNTFRSYANIGVQFPSKLIQHLDTRGAFVEIIRLNGGGQISFSTTKSGITRGNHYHTRKIERFAVIKGKALIQLRRIGTTEVLNFELNGDEPAYVDMPIWYTHNIKNIGDEDLYTIFWINEFFDANDPDTYFETV
jgi:UDP-2-acetamido-2,6-beta-L-arabino-hexul-4-ose reductase